MPDTPSSLVIDVISDVVCPWCFIGKRRLDAALQTLDAPVTVRWHPFELNPDLPREGIDRKLYLERKWGSVERAERNYDRVRAAGATANIEFRFDRIVRQPNTRDAHRLVDWVQDQDIDATPLMEGLFRAYFIEGRSLVGVAALADIAGEAGFEQGAVLAHLESDAGADKIIEGERRAHAIGVEGVPFFIFNRRVAISGAQSTELMLQAIAKAGEALEPSAAAS